MKLLYTLDTKRYYAVDAAGKRYIDDTVELTLYTRLGATKMDVYQAEADTIPDMAKSGTADTAAIAKAVVDLEAGRLKE